MLHKKCIFALKKNIKKKELNMATITLEYDGRNTVFNQLIKLFVSLGGKVKTASSKEAKEIAECCAGVKSGKIKTRPLSQLIDEL